MLYQWVITNVDEEDGGYLNEKVKYWGIDDVVKNIIYVKQLKKTLWYNYWYTSVHL